ncbi:MULTISPECIES: hypothetical protein [Bradyrhizobium]|uniref:hypothetical protein n=1 Tax=Bradyrhizobium TaxID=374 RepID=UPI00155E25A5|nr:MULTISPECIES: hypothetical protein [Bradyrhizobium]MDD1516622.1 hypothetical protein [Bradyrhizobium sp. WBAH30]MDD1542828.1 hypothetical protein [Bradyrhizobium sp. WBAH41]MDD1554525.1 hypothetical protein [Bradyrhizobium sp. WBAH23]MDD1562476.1 hypothetical protein [Bradyrhizobium sp. WBAH33]MDD1588770.1 hypothetical protein [Bradyrhizobium sp. WBAH42]
MAKQIHHPLQSDEKHVEQVRKAIRDSLEVLKLPRPDTFLGRQTHEPVPSEHDPDVEVGQRRKPA